MKKRILVIGGSYFIGRVFCIFASQSEKYEISVLNRGTVPLPYPHVQNIVCNRHDRAALSLALSGHSYDAVIDFCAYRPCDISSLLNVIKNTGGHYIEISSCSVLAPSPTPRAEGAALIRSAPTVAGGEYAYHKMLLEQEARDACAVAGVPCTILRPAFVYGPFNYAPRESYYFKAVLGGDSVPFPSDSDSLFQFVYVKDIARLIDKCIANPAAANKTYHLCAPEQISYASLHRVLDRIFNQKISSHPVRVATAEAQKLPLPFPLLGNDLYRGDQICTDLDFSYTPFETGMADTLAFFRKTNHC